MAILNKKMKESKKVSKKRVVESDSSEDEFYSEDSSNYETISESSSSEENDSEENDSEEESQYEDEEEDTSDSESKIEKTNKTNKKNKKHHKDDEETTTSEETKKNAKELEKSLFSLLKQREVERKKKEATSSDSEDSDYEPPAKKTKKTNQKKKNTKNTIKNRSKSRKGKEESESEEYDDDEDDDEIINNGGGGGIILSLDGFGGMHNDEVDYDEMIAEDKNEKCDSDDEEMFMKEVYEKKEGESKKVKKNKKKPEKPEKDTKPVEDKYKELVKVRQDLEEKLKTMPKNSVYKKAIKDCRKSINELVKKERIKNTKEYYELVYNEPKKKKNTNEMSYFKKKLSHKEQLRVMKDLKEINAFTNIDKPYRLALLETDIPPKFKAIAMQKLNVLKSMEPNDSEYYKMKNWVDGFMRIPYGIYKNLSVKLSDGLDECHQFIENARNTLDTCTYGLDDAKLQILQMVGQWITNPSAMGTAIAIKGPPGTGKTTLVKEGISKILGREFAFIALGGTSDASFLEGHSYTYEGSTWGKIVSILMECKCMNPVIYFDELDKISDTSKGEEIASILTHLTDTSQNNQFHDKYFSEVDFDLSKCLFIFSYNDESKINPILKDRMYRIQTKGYEAKEKIIIARKHLLPKIREQVNFKEEDVVLDDDTLQYIIGHPEFCKNEQGVRNLKRCLEIIHTKINLFRLVKPESKIFENQIKMEVSFPFKVEKKHVDILIKTNEPLNQSMLAMYV